MQLLWEVGLDIISEVQLLLVRGGGVMFGICFGMSIVAVGFMAEIFLGKTEMLRKVIRTITAILAIMVVIILTENMYNRRSPQKLFRRVVLDHVPTSVTNIQAFTDFGPFNGRPALVEPRDNRITNVVLWREA